MAGSRTRTACTGWCASRRSTPMRGGTPRSPASSSFRWSTTASRSTSTRSDVRTDVMRSGGAGGQHVNKTESAVRLTHIPTNIVVKCQQDRSQHRNRAMAWDMLRAKLFEAEIKKREDEGRGRAGRQDRHRLGPPDPLLRAAALSDGEGPAHRRLDLEHRRRARRRSRRIHAGRAGAESLRRRAGEVEDVE